MKSLILVLLLTSFSAFALKEDTLQKEWHAKALPHFQNLKEGHFKNAQGMNLSFRQSSHLNHKKTLIILPGFSEPAQKYAEVLYDLRLEYNLFILDHQDHGDSGRWLKDPQRTHVWKFDDYVRDLKQFVNETILPQTEGHEHYLLAHSMGGAIAIKYLAGNPGIFKKAVLNAPMLEVFTDPYSEPVAMILTALLVNVGRGQEYAPTKGPYVPELDIFELNTVTNSEARFDIAKYNSTNWPHLAKGGPTSRWGYESLKMTKSAYKLGSKIKIPVLLFQAGKDRIVKPTRQNSFCSLAVNCEKKFFPLAQHEILMEKDEDRDIAMKMIKVYLK